MTWQKQIRLTKIIPILQSDLSNNTKCQDKGIHEYMAQLTSLLYLYILQCQLNSLFGNRTHVDFGPEMYGRMGRR
jgi:hypothetical protein